MLVRKRLDIHWTELFRAGVSALGASESVSRRAVASIEAEFGTHVCAWPCLSVRTGFAATLEALALPRGSEVLTSAITIPGMLRILQGHGLVSVPFDVEPLKAAPSLVSADHALTSRTRAILSASLFGTRQDSSATAAWAQNHGLTFIADEAQAFHGSASFASAPADVTLLSFGPIKTCTAVAGAVLLFRDRNLRNAVSAVADEYPTQVNRSYAARTFRFAIIKALGYGPVADLAAISLRAVGRDPDAFAAQLAQSFPGDDFFRRIRRRPASSLLATLARRLTTFDADRIASRAAAGNRLRERIGPEFVVVGADDPRMTYWTFPILVEDPWTTAEALRRRGYDATARSSLTIVEPGGGGDSSAADRTRSWFERTLFLPFDVSYSRKRLDRMAGEFLRVARPFRPELSERTSTPAPRRIPPLVSAEL